MQLFGEYQDETIYSVNTEAKDGLAFMTNRGKASTDRSTDLNDQFLLFQFNDKEDGPAILGMTEVEPLKQGSDEQPDAMAMIQLESFYVGANEGIEGSTRATLRLNFGKDADASSPLDTVFWAVAAGLRLYDAAKRKPSEAADLEIDFNAAFSHRPIEIPGALGRLSFEVVKHKEPKWWQKVFVFLQSGTGRALTSAVGFPAITQQAIGFLDELCNRLEDTSPEVLFRGRPTTLALTQHARDEFQDGVPGIKVGVLNKGFCLLARGRDYQLLKKHDPVYMGDLGLLRPKEMPLEDFLRSPAENPFNEITYVVMKVLTKECKLIPML